MKARPADTTAFQPANESHMKRNAGSSQRTAWLSLKLLSKAAAFSETSIPPEQLSGPGHHPHSTPE